MSDHENPRIGAEVERLRVEMAQALEEEQALLEATLKKKHAEIKAEIIGPVELQPHQLEQLVRGDCIVPVEVISLEEAERRWPKP